MTETRRIERVLRAQPTVEGAGVHLHRVFGFSEAPGLDPFLLLDDFRGDDPDKYLAGFPWHPHRGIETITYVLEGEVAHGDSMGNKGSIGPGDVQWMTAGSGVIHQEMPKGDDRGRMGGFQLWANLPAADKMMPPRYRGIARGDIPTVSLASGVGVGVISGEVQGTKGPVRDIVIDPEYLDVTVPAGTSWLHPVKDGHRVIAYVIAGKALFCPERKPWVSNREAVVFGERGAVSVKTEEEGVRFLLVSGRPIGEPVAWYGPIVMNTREELEAAFEEYRQGTFIRG